MTRKSSGRESLTRNPPVLVDFFTACETEGVVLATLFIVPASTEIVV